MGESYDLFGGVPPHQSHSDTSKGAAMKIKDKAGTLKSKVRAFIIKRGPKGATDWEIQQALKITVSSQVQRKKQHGRAKPLIWKEANT